MPDIVKNCLLSSLILLVSGCTLMPRPGHRLPAFYRSQAQSYITERRYGEALLILEEGAQLHPEDVTLLINIGQIYLTQRRWLLAEDAFNRALARDLDNAEATAGLAEALLKQDRLTEALKFWQRAASIDPALPGVLTGLGRTYLALFDFEAARSAFVAQQAQSQDFEALWYLAALTAPRDVATAWDYLLAIPTPNVDGNSQANVSTSLVARRDYLSATLAPFSKASPQGAVAKATGVALVQAELWPVAVYALEAALEQFPADLDPVATAETLAFLGHARAQAGKPALDLFSQARAAKPDSALPLYFEGLYLRQQGALLAAEDLFEQAIALDPENAAIYFELARLKEVQGDLATAEVWYLAAIEIAEDKRPFQRALLGFYMSRNYKMIEAGIPLVEDLLKTSQEEAELHDILGWMQFLSGAPDGGRAALQQAVALEPALVSARYHLARYYEANQQPASAQAEYQRVIDLDKTGFFRDQALKGVQRLAAQ